MSNTALAAAAAAKREEMLRKKEHWFAQRLAAQEREKLAEEQDAEIQSLSINDLPRSPNPTSTTEAISNSNPRVHNDPHFTAGVRQPAGYLNSLSPSDDQVLDRITERITSRLREEVRSEVGFLQYPAYMIFTCHFSFYLIM
jgi:hypothetical protein